MADLNTFVWLSDEHGEPHGFGPGDEVPAWAAAKIGDHCYVGDESTEVKPRRGRNPSAPEND